MSINKLMTVLPDMAVFVLVVEAGSFSAAAGKLNMTPSAVSRQIARLEKALQVRLLERTTRRQVATAEGEIAYEKCRAMMDLGAEVAQISDRNAEVGGDIYFAAPKAYARHILMPLVNRFLVDNPKVNIHFRVMDTFMNPQRDNVDLVVRFSNALIDGLVSKPLHPMNFILCASPAFLEQNGAPEKPEDLRYFSCITLGEIPEDFRWRFRQGSKDHLVVVSGRYANNHSEMRLSAAKLGLGITILPEFVAQEALASGELVQLFSDWELLSRYQGMLTLQYAQNNFMPARLRSFIDYLVNEIGKK